MVFDKFTLNGEEAPRLIQGWSSWGRIDHKCPHTRRCDTCHCRKEYLKVGLSNRGQFLFRVGGFPSPIEDLVIGGGGSPVAAYIRVTI